MLPIMPDNAFPIRINKYLALKGFSTRRGADELIERGLVFRNGKRARLGDIVQEADTVEVRAKPRAYRYFAYNKPRGVITHSPQRGEKDALSASGLSGVFPVGRLDKDSTGLLILTDDARVTERLLSPRFAHEKEYLVTATRKLPSYFKKRMEGGVDIEGYTTRPAKVILISPSSCRVTLTEGKKHQIRRMFAALGAEVKTLERVRVMNIRLRSLKKGEWREIEGAERAAFLKALGL